MTDEVWTDTEWTAFYRMADTLMAPANDLIATEATDEVAAAMLYACARFNTFAMQAQADDPDDIGAEAVAFLAEEFDSHLRDQMEERVCSNPAGRDNPAGGPGRAIAVLEGLEHRDQASVSDFLDLADRFLDVANGIAMQEPLARVSAAFMHAATRFNVYAMQFLGHPAEQVDERLVAEFTAIYTALVQFHAQDTLIADEI